MIGDRIKYTRTRAVRRTEEFSIDEPAGWADMSEQERDDYVEANHDPDYESYSDIDIDES